MFVAQFTLSQPVISILSGPRAAEVVPYAVEYSRIRSLGSIAAVPCIVAQASLLAQKDSITPLYAVLFSSVINVIGDVVMVLLLGKGLPGAAWVKKLICETSLLKH